MVYTGSLPLASENLEKYLSHHNSFWDRKMIRFQCPQCSNLLSAKDEYQGKRCVCNHCNSEIVVHGNLVPLPIATQKKNSKTPEIWGSLAFVYYAHVSSVLFVFGSVLILFRAMTDAYSEHLFSLAWWWLDRGFFLLFMAIVVDSLQGILRSIKQETSRG